MFYLGIIGVALYAFGVCMGIIGIIFVFRPKKYILEARIAILISVSFIIIGQIMMYIVEKCYLQQ